MSLQTTLFSAVAAAALALCAVAVQAAPQEVVKLPRVVVTGHATQVAQLPRVVVTGYAQREVAQLPRVVVVGFSEATLARQTLAAAKTGNKRI
jgi:outer membrane receptor protein involved in Fe transport